MNETLIYQIIYLYKNFLVYVNKELKDYQISMGQLPFLLYIGKYKTCTPASLTKDLKMDWGHSQRSITKLVDQGLVIKTYDSVQKRQAHLALSEKGQDIFEFCHKLFQKWDHDNLSFLGEPEKQMAIDVLQQVVKNLG